MPITLSEVAECLTASYGRKFRFELLDEDSMIRFSFGGLSRYRDADGEACLRVRILVLCDGNYLEVHTPNLYSLKDCAHVEAVSRVLLGVCWRSPLLQYSLDESDGEVRGSAEVVVADGTLTPAQIRETIDRIVDVIEAFHPHIVDAIERGVVSFPNEPAVRSVLPTPTQSEGRVVVSADIDAELRKMVQVSRANGMERRKSALQANRVIIDWV